jgi:hypothetical protein
MGDTEFDCYDTDGDADGIPPCFSDSYRMAERRHRNDNQLSAAWGKIHGNDNGMFNYPICRVSHAAPLRQPP